MEHKISTTQDLYSISPKTLANLPYKQALQLKIEGAKSILITLLEPNFMDRDSYRINKINKAIKFNEQLLKELT